MELATLSLNRGYGECVSRLTGLFLAAVPLPLRRLFGAIVKMWGRLKARNQNVRDLAQFLGSWEPEFRLRLLTRMDPGRVISLSAFSELLTSIAARASSVAIVSGSDTEPEIRLLDGSERITYLTFAENPDLFDLGRDWTGLDYDPYLGAYDLVLCEQVLEHVVDPRLAVQNLVNLLAPGGILHISVPAVNNRHGEPFYYYSGFAEQLLEIWLRDANLEVLECSSWRSDKGSRMYATSDWAPLAESGPLVFLVMALKLLAAQPDEIFRVFRRRIRHRFLYPFQPLFSRRPTVNAVVTWAVARLPFDPR